MKLLRVGDGRNILVQISDVAAVCLPLLRCWRGAPLCGVEARFIGGGDARLLANTSPSVYVYRDNDHSSSWRFCVTVQSREERNLLVHGMKRTRYITIYLMLLFGIDTIVHTTIVETWGATIPYGKSMLNELRKHITDYLNRICSLAPGHGRCRRIFMFKFTWRHLRLRDVVNSDTLSIPSKDSIRGSNSGGFSLTDFFLGFKVDIPLDRCRQIDGFGNPLVRRDILDLDMGLLCDGRAVYSTGRSE